MKKTFRILTINPGSTSTKIALFENENRVFEEVLRHRPEEISRFKGTLDQYQWRKDVVLKALKRHGVDLGILDAVVGRGGLLPPLESGTYRVNQEMLDYLRNPNRERTHPSDLGAMIAYEIASPLGIPAFIVDPVSVDEFDPLARISGLPEIERKSLSHALNLKAMARRAAKDLGREYHEVNLVVTHMGGGISVSAHRKGRMIDVNQALDGTGPFSPERAGGLPVGDVLRLAYSGKYTYEQLFRRITKEGGLLAHLGTNDAREVERRIEAGDRKAALVYEAMAYQIAKEIGGMATTLKGDVDAVVLTGGLAHSKMLVGWIKERTEWIAPVLVYPGEDELLSMAQGALRVLTGKEAAKEFSIAARK